jgi:hypothetical protein
MITAFSSRSRVAFCPSQSFNKPCREISPAFARDPHGRQICVHIPARVVPSGPVRTCPSRFPASCVPHGAPSGFCTFTPPGCLFPLLSGACAGQGSHHRPPRRHTGLSALPCRFAAAALRRALHAIRVPSPWQAGGHLPNLKIMTVCRARARRLPSSKLPSQ